MKDFSTTKHCQMRVHCLSCRTDKEWRDNCTIHVPDICPHGVTAEDLPAPVDLNALATERQAICDLCDHEGCSMKHRSNCWCKARLNRPNFHCPQDKF